MGLFTLQWAKIFGAKMVTVFGRTQKTLELAKRLGADNVINTTDADFKDQVKALTNGHG